MLHFLFDVRATIDISSTLQEQDSLKLSKWTLETNISNCNVLMSSLM